MPPTGPTAPPIRPVSGLEVIDVAATGPGGFFTLIGLAASGDAVWTVAVLEGEDGGAQSLLVRIDAISGEASTIPIGEAVGMLSPPAASGESVWTGSDRALHRIDGNGDPQVTTVPLTFDPAEISVGAEGLWIAHDGGTSLVDPATGEVLRQISAGPDGSGRIIGAPAFGSLWACADTGSVGRIDPVSGQTVATIALPADSVCQGRLRSFSGVSGLGDAVIPGPRASVIIDAGANEAARTFDIGEPWSDFVVVDGALWFAQPIRGDVRIGLAEIDPATFRPSEIVAFEGRFHLNATYDSESLAVAGDNLWALVDSGAGDVSAFRPQIVRIPLSELR